MIPSVVDPPKEEFSAPAPVQSAAPARELSLFEKLGMELIQEATTILYESIKNDDDLKGFFDSTDMNAQVTKMTKYLAYSFGAPISWDGR